MVSNIIRISKDIKGKFFFIFIIVLPLIDLAQLYLSNLKFKISYNPIFAAFLTGSSEGHISQILLFWFLPIYLLLLCSEMYIQDVNNGYNSIIISKVGKRRYIRSQLLTSFFTPALTMFFSLIINWAASYLIFHGGTFSTNFFETDWSTNSLAVFSQEHPFLIYFLFLLNVCFITGLAGVMGMCISFISPKRAFVYPVTFFFWFIQVVLHSTIINLFQPFTELELSNILPVFVRTILIFLILTSCMYVIKVKTDEI